MKKPIAIVAGLILVVVVLTITRAIVSNSLSTSGVDLTKLTNDIDHYQRENALLEEKILKASSYTYLEEQAGKQGFAASTSQVVLTNPLPMAYNQ